jgi:hypothetical protein
MTSVFWVTDQSSEVSNEAELRAYLTAGLNRMIYAYVTADDPLRTALVPDGRAVSWQFQRRHLTLRVQAARVKALRHRLNALAIARTDQSCNIQRTHPLPRLMTQPVQERHQPAFELVFPSRHGQPSKSRLPMNH